MKSSNLLKRPLHAQQGATPIQLLHKLAPPHAIIHIGAGNGMGEMHQWQQWDIKHALIVDADPSRLDWAEQRSADQPGWHRQSAVLTDTAGELDYHQASNPEEDGILPPELLTPLWPNLRTTEKGVRQGQRLDQLLAKTGNAAFVDTTLAWLIVDCLPALPILKGAGEVLEHCSVLWLRVLQQPISAADTNSALLDNIAAYLQPKGFKCIDVSPGNHPALGYAIFIKDWQAVLTPQLESRAKSIASLTQANDQQSKLAAERQSRIDALTQERDAQTQLATERQAQMQQLSAERDTQAQTVAERQSRIDALTQERDAQTQLATERQAQMQQLAAERDTQAQAVAERQSSIDALTQERDAQTQLASQRKTEADQLQAKLQQRDARIAQLESELAERDTRQQLLNDEMIRAEAQIDLIKDVLLREPGL
jgi:hypothetical protein